MKRPEGFDRSRPAQPAPAARPPAPPRVGPDRRTKPGAPVEPTPAETPIVPERRAGRQRPPRRERADDSAVVEAARELRRAERDRRRYERREARRFTRASRRRRITWLVVASCFVVLGAVVAGTVYSPLLSLDTITVHGASRVNAADVRKALSPQLGRPLALVDFGQIKKELGAFPLIRSYVTETRPPHTLVVTLTERAPIGLVPTASGYSVIDPAGVELSSGTDRPTGLPVISAGNDRPDSAGFRAAVAVLLSLPPDLLARVDTITAQTTDDVTLVLTGGGPTVVWGSAEETALKAQVFADVLAGTPGAQTIDVSVPSNPTFTK